MKRKFILLFSIGCLIFASCEKEEPQTSQDKDVLELNGKNYEIDFLKRGLSRLLNIPLEKLIYDEQDNLFRHPDFTIVLDPKDYINDIETIKNEGYEF